MMHRLGNRLSRGFCVEAGLEKIYDMIYQVKDLTKIRKVDTQTPYFVIDHKKMEMPQD